MTVCLAIPAQVVAIENQTAQVEMLGNVTKADISLLDDVQLGDYLIVHAGFAIQKYNESEAQLTLGLIQEMLAKKLI